MMLEPVYEFKTINGRLSGFLALIQECENQLLAMYFGQPVTIPIRHYGHGSAPDYFGIVRYGANSSKPERLCYGIRLSEDGQPPEYSEKVVWKPVENCVMEVWIDFAGHFVQLKSIMELDKDNTTQRLDKAMTVLKKAVGIDDTWCPVPKPDSNAS